MKQSERMNTMMRILAEKHNASTQYLSKVLDVSESTVRRDIEFLASLQKDVHKVHGGVILKSADKEHEYMFELKLNVNVEFKRRVARAVVARLGDNDSVVLDSGTTCLLTATELHRRQDLRIATVDLQVAMELAKHDHIESLIIGGLIRPGYYSVGDALAMEMLDRFSIDKAVIGADAVDLEAGVTNYSIFEVGVKQKLIETASHCILAADYTKFGTRTFYKIAALTRFETVVTNTELDENIAEAIREMGIELVLA